jgi:predicted DNA-binding transcriptional regulator AlpA
MEERTMNSALIDAAQLAKHLGQAKSSIYRLHKRGVIPAYAAGPNLHGLRFDLNEVKEALRRPARPSQGEDTPCK